MKLKPTINQPKFKALLSFTGLILHDLEENINSLFYKNSNGINQSAGISSIIHFFVVTGAWP